MLNKETIQNRNMALDIIRFVAIMLVLGRHTYHFFNGVSSDNVVFSFFFAWKKIGWIGVEIFFVMSGYLVGTLIFNEINKTGKFDITRFLIRRGFKIYPSYYLFFAFTLIYYKLKSIEIIKAKVFSEMFFYQNYMKGFWNHTWSLAVEEHFYIILSILILLIVLIEKIDLFPRIAILAILFVFVLRCVKYKYSVFEENEDVFLTHFRIDSLLIGSLIAYYKSNKNSYLVSGRFGLILSSVIVFISFLWPFFYEQHVWETFVFGYALLNVGFSLALIVVLERVNLINTKSKLAGLMANMGRGSYNIYIWHMFVALPVLTFVNRQFPLPYYASIILYMTLSVLVGLVLTKYVEEPILKLRNKLTPSKV